MLERKRLHRENQTTEKKNKQLVKCGKEALPLHDLERWELKGTDCVRSLQAPMLLADTILYWIFHKSH